MELALANMPTTRCSFQTEGIDRTIYAMGVNNDNEYTVEAYTVNANDKNEQK